MYSLTTPQQNIWNLQKYYEKTSISNLCGAIFYDVKLDYAVLNRAINKEIEIQAGLRLKFNENDGTPVQYVSSYEFMDIPFIKFDNYEDFNSFSHEYATTPIDLIENVMYKFTIFELNGVTGVIMAASHLISDAWSFSLLIRNITNHYNAMILNSENDCSEISYIDYLNSEIKYLESERYKNDKEYWEKHYSEKPEPCSIKMITVPVSVPTAARYTHIISSEKTAEINRFCTESGVSQAVLFESAVMLYLSRINNENKTITLGIPVLNRTTLSEKITAGMFISTTPLTVAVSKEDTVALLCDKISMAHKELFRHQKYPYSHILQNIREKYDFIGNLYDVMVSFQNAKTDTSSYTKWYSNGYSEVPFSLHIDNRDSADSYTMTIDYQTEVFKQSGEINLLVERILHIINQIMENNSKAVSEISIIPDAEYDLMINKFNDTATDYPKDKCVHELFTEQAAKTPDKIALVFEDKQFTYKQLDEMSNSLAHYLREKGVKPNDVVPIIAKRSWHIIVAMLGILKAGGAYMPVDPTYPIDRIGYMINETNAKFVLAYGQIPNTNTPIINLAECDYTKNVETIENINAPKDLCYVLFTSGSTGKPKAAMITHCNLCNFTNNNNNNNPYQCNMLNVCASVMAVTTFSFDISVFEIYLSLINGLKVVLSNEKENDSADLLADLIIKHNVDIIHSTPTKFLMYLEKNKFQKAVQNIKMLMIGAEVFTQEIYNKISQYTNATIYNGYGPTETTIGVTFKRINNKPCVHKLFAEQAAKTPDKIALVFEDKQFTYKQLDEMSNSLAHYLREKGVKPNDVVPIIAKRSWHIIVAMLGILKAGGAYMPVDPTYPIDRIEYMFETANVKIAVMYDYDESINVDSIDLAFFDYSENNSCIDNVNSPEDLCYIIFTSGSTGKPKGVAICHRNVGNYCDNNKNNVCYRIIKDSYDSIVSVTNTIFDIFVTESILPLLNGITIYFANDKEIASQEKLSELVLNAEIDVIQTTPTKMRSYILDKNNTAYLNALKVIVLGGEALPTDLFLELKQYTDAEIFNIYGPAETTVWSTNKKVDDIDITIGKPIANTQIYILDQNKKPLPIGVAGELCISGDGVGKGYLNRPEMTAEKFIPNPFYDEKSNSTAGKTMYCTGDLARWRNDGEIEYLGRIDTQVKIRGLRIELGEIESVMSSFDGIHMTAVTDKRDENNRQYLVGYYTADNAIDEKALRQHLAAKLPKYMVPNYFVHLDEMPMTASGKTDRKNLPLPDFTVSQEEYVAPETKLEKQLCGVLCELFAMEQIGVTDDFFDIGGDSLKAIEYVAKAHTAGVEFALQNVFDYPTVRELCSFLENGAEKVVRYTAADFEKYEEILRKNVIDESFVPERKSLGNVLLTGATGFLGAHILDYFMQNETGKIYCLVRGSEERLRDILNYYFENKYDSEIGNRIIFLAGDITNTDLSADINDDIQTVIHTAATVKHYGSYEYFCSINVEGTRNVVNFAKRVNAKLIHISTLSVSGNSLADEFSVYHSEEEKNFYEYSLFIGQPLENVYVRSKFEAELQVLNAMLEGLDAKIVRVGNLTNRLSDSKFQLNYESNAFLTRFKAAVELGMFPDYLLPLYAEFSPIDQTAEGVVKIAQYADKQCVFHLNSNRPIYFDRLLEVFKQLDIKMELVSGEMFNNVLQQIAKDSKKEYIYEAFQNDMDENGQLVYDSNIHLRNDFTDWFMRNLDFEWAQIDFEYIRDYVEYFRGIGYLEV